ncbi:helix-turn-helix transcriptional regulator [Alteribacillus sp. HJP-4]|uniref:helix-turn-helix transcriptional regulator n=1 Tax=Alteribacillus sp. HJP-4 TaxID=2775394 RepID=UPI0035CD0A7D
MSIENNIRMLRARDHLTQSDLADKVNVTRQTIVALEKGSYVPSLQLAFDLAKVFQMRVDELFYEENDEDE